MSGHINSLKLQLSFWNSQFSVNNPHQFEATSRREEEYLVTSHEYFNMPSNVLWKRKRLSVQDSKDEEAQTREKKNLAKNVL